MNVMPSNVHNIFFNNYTCVFPAMLHQMCERGLKSLIYKRQKLDQTLTQTYDGHQFICWT